MDGREDRRQEREWSGTGVGKWGGYPGTSLLYVHNQTEGGTKLERGKEERDGTLLTGEERMMMRA